MCYKAYKCSEVLSTSAMAAINIRFRYSGILNMKLFWIAVKWNNTINFKIENNTNTQIRKTIIKKLSSEIYNFYTTCKKATLFEQCHSMKTWKRSHKIIRSRRFAEIFFGDSCCEYHIFTCFLAWILYFILDPCYSTSDCYLTRISNVSVDTYVAVLGLFNLFKVYWSRDASTV